MTLNSRRFTDGSSYRARVAGSGMRADRGSFRQQQDVLQIFLIDDSRLRVAVAEDDVDAEAGMAELVELAGVTAFAAGDVAIGERGAALGLGGPGDVMRLVRWSLGARQAVGHEDDVGRRVRLPEVAAQSLGGISLEAHQPFVVNIAGG